MFMMNIKHLKKMQANQLEDLRELEIKNGSTVGKIPCSRPIKHSREQKGLQLLNRSHTLLKVRPLRSIHTIHIIHSGTKFKITFESSGPMICFFLFFYLAGGDQVNFLSIVPKVSCQMQFYTSHLSFNRGKKKDNMPPNKKEVISV